MAVWCVVRYGNTDSLMISIKFRHTLSDETGKSTNFMSSVCDYSKKTFTHQFHSTQCIRTTVEHILQNIRHHGQSIGCTIVGAWSRN